MEGGTTGPGCGGRGSFGEEDFTAESGEESAHSTAELTDTDYAYGFLF